MKRFWFYLLATGFCWWPVQMVTAQSAVAPEVAVAPVPAAGIPTYIPFADDAARPGMLVSQWEHGYYLPQQGYDNRLFGVIVEATAGAEAGQTPVVRRGPTAVLVTATNGEIKVGDLLTSSTTPGVAVKAVRRGAVVGVALSDFSGDGEGKVGVAVSPHYSLTSGKDTTAVSPVRSWYDLSASALAAAPALALRFTLAALVFYIALSIAIFTVGRSARAGIISLGRNPLARLSIMAGVAVNVAVIMVIIAGGWWVGYQILTKT